MGITGLLKHLGPGRRTSLAVLAAQFYAEHDRPLRLAIDISIWLFHIQAGQGGSNPALRTFYYRLLRMISLNIHPLFVFDGPNKPLFKRNKRVGGPGVRVASVPEFLAKQLLKQFGMPMHVAPGEAEAECAHLQQLGLVDAVMSDDVDTMMFGCTLTLRNWSTEGSSKTPTHVNVYKSSDVLASSSIDREGMILVALMSGGDYLPAGILNCGPKYAVDAAKAGFAQDLLSLHVSDAKGHAEWRERLQQELATNASKFFTRRNTSLKVPSDFPNFEVLNYYTKPCVSSASKIAELQRDLSWSETVDFAALRSFAGEAFDWRNIGGAKAFIRSLAPAILARELRVAIVSDAHADQDAASGKLLRALHGQRQHASADNQMEIRVSYVPADLVPIDLSIEPEDDSDSDAPIPSQQSAVEMNEDAEILLGSDEEDVTATPSRRKRKARPFDPTESTKMWLLREWVQLSYPAMLEDYEGKKREIEERNQLQLQRKQVKANGGKAAARVTGSLTSAKTGMPAGALMRHVTLSKTSFDARSLDLDQNEPDQELPQGPKSKSLFMLPSTQISEALLNRNDKKGSTTLIPPRTPQRRKRAADATPISGRSIALYFTPTRSHHVAPQVGGVVDLTSSSLGSVTPKPRGSLMERLSASKEHPKQTSPERRPRLKMRKSLSMPAVFADGTEDRLTLPPKLEGLASLPHDMSPNVRKKQKEFEALDLQGLTATSEHKSSMQTTDQPKASSRPQFRLPRGMSVVSEHMTDMRSQADSTSFIDLT